LAILERLAATVLSGAMTEDHGVMGGMGPELVGGGGECHCGGDLAIRSATIL